MKAKYIITKSNDAIVFSTALKHDVFKHLKPISAGFVQFTTNDCYCSGKSDSLKLKSQPEDADIINVQIINPL